ncbi:MAG TPA: tripartite tricarboxylate transporter substrate binding protein, partial [Burkholderiales bacterium]|nr:tripartite tricarboxylate transporter substrate binding protein [Burkholderiales bacterium]
MFKSMRTAAALLLASWALACPAQDYPSKPILFLMPLQAGSAVDVMVRIVAQKMSDNLGRQIVVENQP